MTTFHDPQPPSRRAVRQSERADSSETQSGFADSQNSAQFSTPDGDMWDTVSRRAAQLPPVSSLSEEPQPGRRTATPPSTLPEPTNYSTPSRAAAPGNDGPTFRSRGSSAPQPVPFNPSASASRPADQAGFRPRDFSPAAPTAVPESRWSESAPAAQAAPSQAGSDLDYHSEARFRARAAAAPMAPISEVPANVAPINKMWAQPVAEPEPAKPVLPLASDFPLEQTYTRRELRAMQQAESAAAAPVAAQQSSPSPVAQAPQSFAAPPAQPESPGYPLGEPRQGPPPAMPPTASPTFTPTAPVAPAAPVSSSPFESLFAATSAAPTRAEPVAQAPVAHVPVEIAPTPTVDPEPSPWTPPAGHWSTQMTAEEDDDIETTLSRRIGSGMTTTSALVLPSIPKGNDIRGPLTATGEIMLTGSIDLPRMLAATGQSDRYDHVGIDDLLDINDSEIVSTDSSPVRAIRAVSTHTSGHGVTHTQKPKGTRALTALLIAASSMAVVVAGLLVAVFAFNVF